MNGDDRTVRLAFKNRGATACRLSGYPAIELQDDRGNPIASIKVRRTGTASFTGSVAPPLKSTTENQPVDIVLRPGAEASFDIGWTSGDNCPLVSKFTVAAPGIGSATTAATFAGSFAINHPLNVCNGELRISPLAGSGTV
jgi:hypothetical protein